jgi:collagen type III alpha
MLIVRSATSGSRADLERFKLAYSRKILLQLSHSPKIRPPQGLKPLTEWYGEYEMPSLHLGNAATNASGNGRYSARDGQPGRRERGERNGQQNERHVSERERPSAAATPATGQMGDFKLAGQRPFTMPKDNDSGDALSGANRRRQGLRDLEGRDNRGDSLAKEKDVDGKERPWGPPGSTADRRRQLGGEFIKKDGRAAEEGGWRSSRETTKDRQIRERGDRPAYGERNDLRVGSSNSTGDRRRQPAWMDEEKEPTPSSKSGQYSSTQRRAPNGTFSNDATPAWLSDGPDGTGLEDSLEAPSTAKQGSEASHVDSIQAFKAQMKDMERRKKIQDQKELRKEMGLPELPDEEYNKGKGISHYHNVCVAKSANVMNSS